MSGNKGKKDCSKCIHFGGEVRCGGVLCKLVNAIVNQSKYQAGFNRCAYRAWTASIDLVRQQAAMALVAEAKAARAQAYTGTLSAHLPR